MSRGICPSLWSCESLLSPRRFISANPKLPPGGGGFAIISSILSWLELTLVAVAFFAVTRLQISRFAETSNGEQAVAADKMRGFPGVLNAGADFS